MALRQATTNDYEIIAKFGNELITKSKYGPTLFKSLELTARDIPYCVELENTKIVEVDGKPIGFATYQKLPWLTVNVGKIVYVFIETEFRNQGYMKEIKKDFEEWGKNVDCNFLMLGITTGADPSDYEKYEVMYMKEVK